MLAGLPGRVAEGGYASIEDFSMLLSSCMAISICLVSWRTAVSQDRREVDCAKTAAESLRTGKTTTPGTLNKHGLP